MELGEKIRLARQALGLSQRQLCGDEITRNMLSLIENGGAKPSMKTLRLLAERLGKPISYFLEEHAPDPGILSEAAVTLHQARQALAEGKYVYARQLLESVTAPELRREALLLAAKIPGADPAEICEKLPSLDEELLLRAEAALDSPERCRNLLLAAEDQGCPRWQLLMGRLLFAGQHWQEAAAHLVRAEPEYPETIPLLETCFRELADYKQAYEYACKQKK
jgi:transcriptional regulator with XRE-family HTH domain